MGIELQTVNSSNIEAVGYHEQTGSLLVCFKHSQTLYAYLDVPKTVYDQLMESSSKGSFFAKNVKNNYFWEKLEAAPKPAVTYTRSR